MKAKGFTLIELLAVIIILAIIALIAVPIILNVVETSRKNSAVDSAYGYINAIEEGIAIKEVKDGLSAPAGEYTDLRGFENTYNISIKGTKPSEGTFTLERKTVVSAEFIIDGYRVICDKKLCRTTGKLKKITITYNAGAGTTSESSVQINNGSSVTLPTATPTNSNYSFAGWYTGTNCSGNKITNTTPIEDDLDINACYVIKVTNFEYTGNIQSFTAPADGNYKLEVWGAAGAYIYVSGTFNGQSITGREWWSGRGAYSSGNVALKAGDVLYIAVGGKGENRTISESTTTGSTEGGYNGGGSVSDNYSGAGGGATHISKTNTLLKDTSVADLYIVAGGGGGAATALNGVYPTWGSGGGNASGSNTPGNGSCGACGGADYYGHGATQEAGGSPNGSYGQGGNATAGAGGGGGYYGGGSGTASGASGGGGSSYIGGVTNGVTYDGYTQQNTPNGGSTTGNLNGGYARITYLSE